MPQAVSRTANRSDASLASEQSACGLTTGLSGTLAGSGMSLGRADITARKRSLGDLENIPPLRMDGAAPLSAPGTGKPAVSLLDLAAQQLSQSQRKQRRTVITASSPGGPQRITSNPRRATMLADTSILRSLPPAKHSAAVAEGPYRPGTPGSAGGISQSLRLQMPPLPHPGSSGRQTPVLRTSASGSASNSASSSARGARLSRLPKRNLKPLDFSGLRRPRAQAGATAQPVMPGATAGGATAVNKPDAHSSGPPSANILSLPVSPAQSSPVSTASFATVGIPDSSPAIGPVRGVVPGVPGLSNPTPPSTVPRHQPAFSGLLASAYQRASAKRSSKRALSFASSGVAHDESLQHCDPILGPRCPVIGDSRGMFSLGRVGIVDLQREQDERTQSKFSEMTRTVRQAQAAFEASVAEQAQRGRPAARKPGRPPGSTKGRGKGKSASAPSKRPISECKYCGKQYKYHSKLASHEQHCSSRLEALLYSADDTEQHTIHCVCGPRHDHPVGARDDLPMVQCDNCLLWLHIECVHIDEDNLPEEYFCPRCEAGFEGGYDGPYGAALAGPSTPRRMSKKTNAGGVMSPESYRLATLLADVPNNDGSETEEEPMCLRLNPRHRQAQRIGGTAAVDMSSEDTMSISDVAEVTRFHRQGSALRRCHSPVAPRMAQSEADMSPGPTPSRRRRRSVRAGIDGTQPTVHTDALSSDFLGLPLPESIFSEKPNFAGGMGGASGAGDGGFMGTPMSIAPSLCMQQGSMDGLSRMLGDSQPQWSLQQLTSMLSGAGPAEAGGLMGTDSGYLDQALADLGLGFGHAESASNLDVQPNAGSVNAGDPSLRDLVDLPVDDEFSALLDSIASGNPGTEADPYSSLGTSGAGLGSVLSDELVIDAATGAVATCAGAPVASGGMAGAGRMLGGRIGGGNVVDMGHGSSSTITLMQDDSSVCGQDNVRGRMHPAPARPPPGLPAMIRERNGGGSKRGSLVGSARGSFSGQVQQVSGPSTLALSLSSNPPSSTGLGEVDIGQLMGWAPDGEALDRELEGLINFDG